MLQGKHSPIKPKWFHQESMFMHPNGNGNGNGNGNPSHSQSPPISTDSSPPPIPPPYHSPSPMPDLNNQQQSTTLQSSPNVFPTHHDAICSYLYHAGFLAGLYSD